MRAIGILRTDLDTGQYGRDRLKGLLQRTARGDGHELESIIDYDITDPAAIEKVIAAIQAVDDRVVVYAPYRAHLNGNIHRIIEHAWLECVLDNIGWPRAGDL